MPRWLKILIKVVFMVIFIALPIVIDNSKWRTVKNVKKHYVVISFRTNTKQRYSYVSLQNWVIPLNRITIKNTIVIGWYYLYALIAHNIYSIMSRKYWKNANQNKLTYCLFLILFFYHNIMNSGSICNESTIRNRWTGRAKGKGISPR